MNTFALPSKAAEIIAQCPRFRILVLGKSGVGKSSLINCAFNVDLAHVSHEGRGISDIDEEITSPHNPLFVLHDSRGFEPGEVGNFKTVKDFIARRMREPKIEHRLHAIWLCIEIPRSGGRVFETGDEEFLKLDRGSVPVVVVFTKYDLLFLKKKGEARQTKISKDQLDITAKREAEKAFDELCVRPLANVTSVTQYAKVSTKPQHNDTLHGLVKITHDLVQRHVEGDVWIVWAIAQRANVHVNIEASIIVGMKRYWQGMASNAMFGKTQFLTCLDAIHTDIVAVWNFLDPNNILAGKSFRDLILPLIEELAGTPKQESSAQDLQTANVLSTLSGQILNSLGQFVSIAGLSIAFCKFLYSAYQATPGTLRCLMAYIIDLTAILEELFLIALTKRFVPISMDDIQSAFDGYRDSGKQRRVHQDICDYVGRTNFGDHMQQRKAEDETIRLIRVHCVGAGNAST